MIELIPKAIAATTPTPVPRESTRLPTVDLGRVFSFGDIRSLGEGISLLVLPLFGIAGIAVTFYFMIAAIKLITANGDKAKVQAAREMITHSIIGVILLIAAFFIIPFVLTYFGVNIRII